VGGIICVALIGWSVAKSKQETPGLMTGEETK